MSLDLDGAEATAALVAGRRMPTPSPAIMAL